MLLLIAVLNAPSVSAVQAQEPQITVRVSIPKLWWGTCDDLLGPPDIYVKVKIDGFEYKSEVFESNFSIMVVNLAFAQDVDFSKLSIPIVIEQWDEDDWPWDDEQCDLDPGSDKALDLTLNWLGGCTVSGDATGNCGETIIPGGPTHIEFTVDIEEPPRAPGLNVRCLHDPLWPQPGDTVTITAEALDGNADLITTQSVDDIEIWVDDKEAPTASSSTTPGEAGASVFSFNVTPANNADSILYRCKASDNGDRVSSGWRRVQIGTPPATSRAINVVFTQPRSSAVDVVFIPNGADFQGPGDPLFQAAASNIIRLGYYSEPVFLARQDALNFSLAQDTGFVDTRPDPVNGLVGCRFLRPGNWDRSYSFADTGAILHRVPNTEAGCATREWRLVTVLAPLDLSTELWWVRATLHETGHTPFGLADEYPGHTLRFETHPFPNVYDTQAECMDDALNLGRVSGDCRIIDSIGDFNWYTSEPGSNDLMNDGGMPRAADERRINWLFDRCDRTDC